MGDSVHYLSYLINEDIYVIPESGSVAPSDLPDPDPGQVKELRPVLVLV